MHVDVKIKEVSGMPELLASLKEAIASQKEDESIYVQGLAGALEVVEDSLLLLKHKFYIVKKASYEEVTFSIVYIKENVEYANTVFLNELLAGNL